MGKPKKTTGKKTQKDLTVKAANDVKGGTTKAGGDKTQYLVYTLKDVTISG